MSWMALVRQFERQGSRGRRLRVVIIGRSLAVATMELPRGPEQHSLKRIEVWMRWPELGEESLTIALEEGRPELRRQPFLVVGEDTAAHPFDDGCRRFELVRVALEANRLLPVAEVVQERCVRLGSEHR